MARTNGRYEQWTIGITSEQWKELDALRHKNEPWREFFIRAIPVLQEKL